MNSKDPKPLLNVGCGRCYHDDWTNIDLVAAGPGVRQYDLRRGLPYSEDTFEGVYHSHVLEHLSPTDARAMLSECLRVLRPGGVIRVVVPDLEGIAIAYLEALRRIDQHQGDLSAEAENVEIALANHRWMTLEMIDQLSRQKGGGEMGKALADSTAPNRDFIQSRMGYQVTGNDNQNPARRPRKTVRQRLSRLGGSLRKQLAMLAVTLIDGSTGRAAYREGRFRQSGEIHRWMYDRVSLAQLLCEIGFEKPVVRSAQQSAIDGFDSYRLDRDGQSQRKPDSMYMEAFKPASQHAVDHDPTHVGRLPTESGASSKAA